MPGRENPRRAFIGLGSNLGDRRANCLEAVRKVSENPRVHVVRLSGAYETEPEGIISDNIFINAVLEIRTDLQPETLLDFLLGIERQMGRDRSAGPDRIIDLDIIFMEGIMRPQDKSGEGPELPHPRAGGRAFVLVPWAELAPDLMVEPWSRTVGQMLHGLKSTHPVLRQVPWQGERTKP